MFSQYYLCAVVLAIKPEGKWWLLCLFIYLLFVCFLKVWNMFLPIFLYQYQYPMVCFNLNQCKFIWNDISGIKTRTICNIYYFLIFRLMLLDGCLVEKWKDQLNKRFKVNTIREKNADILDKSAPSLCFFCHWISCLTFRYVEHLWVLLLSLQHFNTSKSQVIFLCVLTYKCKWKWENFSLLF